METNSKNMMMLKFGSVDFSMRRGDIFDLQVDAIVCPVDAEFKLKEGLFGLIKKKGGFPPEIFSSGKKFLGGKTMMVNSQIINAKKIILVSVITQYGSVAREYIKEGLASAFNIADSSQIRSLAMPLLGHSVSKPDYGVICGSMLKPVQQFGLGHPKFLNNMTLSIYNDQAFQACQEQFFIYQQSLG